MFSHCRFFGLEHSDASLMFFYAELDGSSALSDVSKWFTNMEVSGWVRRIMEFIRESTLGSVELRQASFCDRTDNSSCKITTCLPKIHLRWYFMHFTAASHKPPRCGPRQRGFKFCCLLNSSWCLNSLIGFIVEPCIDAISVNSNQLMHISVFIKNTLKVYLKFLLPRHVSDHIGIHPQGAIIRS